MPGCGAAAPESSSCCCTAVTPFPEGATRVDGSRRVSMSKTLPSVRVCKKGGGSTSKALPCPPGEAS
jgi:hypothetical protein